MRKRLCRFFKHRQAHLSIKYVQATPATLLLMLLLAS
jgi:hypothetical protein